MTFRAQLDDFAALYERTYQQVYRTALGICGDANLAADVTQDAFESAFRQQARFRGDVPVEAWLHRIAVNAALSGLRRRRVRWAEPLDPVRHDRQVASTDQVEALTMRRAVMNLDPRQRAAVVLRYYHGFDYATIGSILEISTSNVGALLSRALDRLRIETLAGEPSRNPLTTPGEARHGR